MKQPQVRTPIILTAAMASVFMVNVTILMLGPLLVDMSHDLNVSIELAGQLAALMAVPWLVVALLSGALSDTYGRKPVLMVGLGAMAVSSIGTALAWDFASAAVFRALLGFAGAVTTNSIAVVSDYVPSSQRGKALGGITFGSGLGGALGIPAMAIVGEEFGWRWSFAVVGSATVLLWLVLLFVLPHPRPTRGVKVDILSKFRPVIRQAAVWDISLVNVFSRTGLMIMMTYFGSFLILEHGFSTGGTALPLGIISFGIVVASISGGSLADTRFRLLYVPFVMAVSGLVGLATFVFSLHSFASIGLAALYVWAIYLPFPLVITLLSIVGGERLRATTISTVPVGNQTGVLIGPALGGLALAIGGYEALGILCLALGALGALMAASRLRETKIKRAIVALESYGQGPAQQ